MRRFLLPLGLLAICGVLVALPGAAGARTTALPANFGFVLQWGSGGFDPGQFWGPSAIAVAPDGTVYVAGSNRIQRFTPDGTFIDIWDGEFVAVSGIAVAPGGDVYVAEHMANRIQRFTATGDFLGAWGSRGTATGSFDGPSGVAVDASGNVYVSDEFNARIQKFTADGTFLAAWGGGQFNFPLAVAVDAAGNVYLVDSAFHVEKFTSSGTLLRTWGTYGLDDGQFTGPTAIAVDGDGVYVADSSDRIQKFTAEGTFLGAWGGSGSGPGEFDPPSSIATSPGGDVYVGGNNRIQKFAVIQPGNLAPTPDFESATVPSFWRPLGPCTFSSLNLVDAHSPTNALQIGSKTAELCRWIDNFDAVGVTPGVTYDVSVWLKTTGYQASGRLSVNFWTAAGAYVPATVDSPSLLGTHDWTQATLRVTAPPSAAYLRVEFRLNGPGSLAADDVDVRPVGAAPPPAPPLLTSAPVASGTLHVGDTLSTTRGVWTDRATQFDYQWLYATPTGGWEPIFGAVQPTYTLTERDLGYSLRARVRATGNGGTATAFSNVLGPVVEAPPTSGNLAPDAGFELEPSPYWYTNGPAGFAWTTASSAWDHSLEISAPVGTVTTSRWLSHVSLIPVTPGVVYTASVSTKTGSVSDRAELVLTFWTASQSYVAESATGSQTLVGTNDWTPLTVVARAPAGAAYVRIELRQTGSGWTLWDDVSLTR